MSEDKKKQDGPTKQQDRVNGHYINNKEFLAALIEFKEVRANAEVKELPRPQIPDYIARCFLQIGTRLSYRPNFINYTYKDDMISDGVENCLAYMHNFNPDKSENPFAYFTQIIYYAFLRRIQKEKRQQYVKYKYFDLNGGFEILGAIQEQDEGGANNIARNTDQMDHYREFIIDTERKEAEKKAKRKAKQIENLENFMPGEEK